MRRKNNKEPLSVDEAMAIARKKFPENYQEFEVGAMGKQLIDVNSVRRASYASRLIHGTE